MRTDTEHEAARLIPRLIAGVAGACGRRPWLVLLGTLISCGLALHLNFTRLEFQTHRNDLIGTNKECVQRWQDYLDEFGDDDDMVVVVQGKDRRRMEQALEDLATEVRAAPERFDRLFYKVDLRPLRNRALLLLPIEQIREIDDNIKKMRLLLNAPFQAGWKMLGVHQLLEQAASRLDNVKSVEPLTADDEQFLRQTEAICRSAALVLLDRGAYQNPWLGIGPAPAVAQDSGQENMLAAPQFFFSNDGTLAFLLVRPIKEKANFTAARNGVEALRVILARVAPAYPDLAIGLTGLPVLETDEMVASQKDTKLASWLALAGVALLYLVVYRGIRYPFMTVATLLVGTVWALGWTAVTVGHLNILSAAFAVMLIGMGDYGVLWVTRYGQERKAGADRAAAMRTTALSVGSGILTAAVTTALAFYATMLADFKAIAELGWIAGSGVLLCALSCFTVMPALLAIFDFRCERECVKETGLADRRTSGSLVPAPLYPIAEQDKRAACPTARGEQAVWLPWIARRPRLVIGISVAVTAVFALFAVQIRYDHNLLNLQAQELDSVRWEHTLIAHTAGASWSALSYCATQEQALALKARYEQLPGVARVVEVASLVPPGQTAKLDIVFDLQQRLRRLPPRGVPIPHAPPNVKELAALITRLQERLATLVTARPATVLTGFAQSLGVLQDRLAGGEAALTARRLQEFDEWLARDLADELHRLRDVATPESITIADLPECLRERYIGKTGMWLVRVFGKECLWDYGPLSNFVQQIRTVDPDAAGKPFTTLEGLRAMKYGFLWAGLYALIAMVIVLLLDFRNWKHTLVALAPLAMGMIVAVGIMTLCGWPLNPANMIAFPLILGVGADNGVHVLHDYRSRRQGRRCLLGDATGRGIMVAALTTILGFGTLLLSTHRGLASLGLILTLGVTCCMLTALVFLPALLYMQSLRRQKEHRRRTISLRHQLQHLAA